MLEGQAEVELTLDDRCPGRAGSVHVSSNAFAFVHNLGLLDAHQTGSEFPDRSRDLHGFLFGSSTSTGQLSFIAPGVHAHRDTPGRKRYRDTESVHRTALRRTDAAHCTSSTCCRPSKGFHRSCARSHLDWTRRRDPGSLGESTCKRTCAVHALFLSVDLHPA